MKLNQVIATAAAVSHGSVRNPSAHNNTIRARCASACPLVRRRDHDSKRSRSSAVNATDPTAEEDGMHPSFPLAAELMHHDISGRGSGPPPGLPPRGLDGRPGKAGPFAFGHVAVSGLAYHKPARPGPRARQATRQELHVKGTAAARGPWASTEGVPRRNLTRGPAAMLLRDRRCVKKNSSQSHDF